MNEIEKLKYLRLKSQLKRIILEKEKNIEKQDYKSAAVFRIKERNLIKDNKEYFPKEWDKLKIYK